MLTAQSVLNYVYLGEFELLRNSRFNIQERPWAHAAEREAASAYFKLCRTREELERLQVELRRLSIFIDDDEASLAEAALRLQDEDNLIAYQIVKTLQSKVLANEMHRSRIVTILTINDFTGSITGKRKGE